MIGKALGGGVVATGITLGLCMRERHVYDMGPGETPGPSKLDLWLNPPWYIIAGVTLTVNLTDAITRTLLAMPERTFTVSFDKGDENLDELIGKCQATGKPLVIAPNHNTFMDAEVINPLIGRALAGPRLLPWTLNNNAWPFSAAGGSVLFSKPLLGTLTSLHCGLPLQQKWVKPGVPHPEHLFALNTTRNEPDLVRCLNQGRAVVIFPEGRLVQDHAEPRDAQGRWTSHDGRKNEPGGRVAPFFSGIGRLVAHSGALVLPCAHWGIDDILCAGDDGTYSFSSTELRVFGPAHVGLHFGSPLDFGSRLAAFEKAHPHLTPFSAGVEAAVASGDYLGPEKRALYREITEAVREEVLRCHALARKQAAAASANKACD